MLLAQNSKRLSPRKPLKSRNYDKDDFFISIYILPQTNKWRTGGPLSVNYSNSSGLLLNFMSSNI